MGAGKIVIVNVSISPGQVVKCVDNVCYTIVTPLNDGVTLKCATIGAIPLFTAKKAGNVPEPDEPMPKAGKSFVQLLIAAVPENCIPLTPVP